MVGLIKIGNWVCKVGLTLRKGWVGWMDGLSMGRIGVGAPRGGGTRLLHFVVLGQVMVRFDSFAVAGILVEVATNANDSVGVIRISVATAGAAKDFAHGFCSSWSCE